ncbi:trafficking particle complex subunit 8 isoform X3 [Brachionus plicatilis]|uniref:Trafficking particle complex subunit 8 isoform X3 n=1 Tax=Brachionus plicatilis TaxID=10195 RepID=A0A3M7SLE6_BRAPC|nr:trafficking particle complex subunit 8 isoform X3 [Brachionus plicatilis]
MTQRQKPEKEFLQESFLPQIAVCCSYDAEVICRKNNLTFVELIQPFSKYNGENINHIDPQPIAIKKILESCMFYNAEEDTLSSSSFENHLYKITTNTCTPWFEKWRENFIKYCIKEDHEFIRNYLGFFRQSIFVVSTSHIDPLDQFQKLVIQEQTDSNQNNCKKWFFSNFANVYKYFVLLHDVQEGEISKAYLIYESLKNSYGSSNCHLLQINSKSFENHDFDKTYADFDPWSKYCKLRDTYKNFDSPNDSIVESSEHNQERHGMCLSLSDHDRIKTFFSEFLTRGLIPYAEKTIRVLNEQFQSKKNILKGFSISKKFFGLSNSSLKTSTSPIISLSNLTMNPQDTSTSSSKATGSFFNSNNQFVHTNDDLNTRRLADLTFLFQFYELSLYYYVSFKKDFASIQNSAFVGSENSFCVKLHSASVLEMASIAGYLNSVYDQSSQSNLSSFTQNKNINTQYIEEALQIYTNECKNDSYSTRCLLFSTEIFRMISNHSKAASQLINFYVDENDLRRPLFLEQAAYYCLIQSPSNFRKFSFLITLAGENFKKIGQSKIFVSIQVWALKF